MPQRGVASTLTSATSGLASAQATSPPPVAMAVESPITRILTGRGSAGTVVGASVAEVGGPVVGTIAASVDGGVGGTLVVDRSGATEPTGVMAAASGGTPLAQ